LQEIEALKGVMTERSYQAQYQQNPSSDEGGMFRRDYWQYHQMSPQVAYWIWSWDTAMEDGEENDYTVGVLLGFHSKGVCIERVIRARMQYPELKRAVEMEWAARPATVLLIEDKVSGKSLQQELRRTTDLPVVRDEGVKGDKTFRASLASPYVESGRVSLKEGAPWVPEFVEEFADFPNSDFKDQVDAVCQAINYYYLKGQRPAAALVGRGFVLAGEDGRTQSKFSDWE
jgi:predicted phage terminase large subunit-like protein